MSETPFQRDLRRAYRKYKAACAENGTQVVPKWAFRRWFERQIAVEINKKQRAYIGGDPGRSIYVVSRVSSVGMPRVDSVKRTCAQCLKSVWVDRENVDMADGAHAIICSVCIPEVTGKDTDQVFTETMQRLFK